MGGSLSNIKCRVQVKKCQEQNTMKCQYLNVGKIAFYFIAGIKLHMADLFTL